MSQTITDKLDKIYETKLQIKSAIGTSSDVFEDYPSYIRAMSGGGGVSYSYLDERLSYYVETEDLNTTLSYYVETSDLESMGYITIEDVPQVDLSSYVTYTYLESKEYLTEIPDTYATYAAISEMGYITYSYGDSQYVSYAYIGDLNEITEYILGSSSSEAPENVYATKYELGSYVSKDELDNASYITQQMLDNASYATESYVTNAINNIPSVDTSSYVTYSYLDSCGYVTSNDLPVINENIIPKESSTYTLGDANHMYDATYTNAIKWGTTKIYNDSNSITFSVNNYGGMKVGPAHFSPRNGGHYTLGTTSSVWESAYVTYTYTNTAYLQDTSYSSSIVPKETGTYTLGDANYLYSTAYVSDIYTSGKCRISNRSDNQINIQLNNGWKYTIHSNGFSPATTNQDLGNNNPWKSTYTQNIYITNETYLPTNTYWWNGTSYVWLGSLFT